MKKITLSGILIAGCFQLAIAQQEQTMDTNKDKKFNHYVGVQINGLIRQVLNFSNNTSTTPVNPYLLTYSINFAKTGWGLRTGIGYTYNSSNVKDGIIETDSKINDVHARLGIEKRFELSKKWSAGAGLDGLYDNTDHYTNATIHSFDTTTTITKSKLPSYGGGGMAWLRYHITDKILIGTEASFYYVKGTEDREVEVIKKKIGTTPPFSSTITSTVTNSEPKLSDASFKLPVVFYLVVKF